MSKFNVKKIINNSRVHYLKWEVEGNPNLSLRYYYTFQDRKPFECKFYLKNHDEAIYAEINEEAAIFYIENLTDGMVEEIVGYKKESGHYIKNKYKNGKMIQTHEIKGKIKKVKEYTLTTLDFDTIQPLPWLFLKVLV